MAVFASSPHHWQLNKPLSSSSSLHSDQNPIIMFVKFTYPDNQFFDYQKNSMTSSSTTLQRRTSSFTIVNALNKDSNNTTRQDDEVKDAGVKAALSMLKFYKREISPLLPNSCRYVPTCSEYSMEAYKKYGVVKGTVLTACRLCRCNPLGGSGFDPPRWFDEASPPEQ